MEQNEQTQNAELEQQNDELIVDLPEEGEQQTDEQDESQSDESGESEAELQARLAKAESEAAKYRRLFEKTQKKPSVENKEASSDQRSPSVDVDERILRAQGVSDELLDELRVVAKGRGIDLITAQQDPLFVAAKERLEEEAKKKAASLGASRGSGAVKPKKDFTTPGLSDDDHRALFNKAISK